MENISLGLDRYEETRTDKIKETHASRLYTRNLTTGTKNICNIFRLCRSRIGVFALKRAHQ